MIDEKIVKNTGVVLGLAIAVISVVWFYVSYTDPANLARKYFEKAYDIDHNNPKQAMEAIQYYKQAITAYEEAGDPEGAAGAYIYLGLLHFRLGNITPVEDMILKAISLNSGHFPKKLLANAYIILAEVTQKEPEKSFEYAKKAFEYSNELELNPQLFKVYLLMGKSFESRALFEDALEYYTQAVELLEQYPHTIAEVNPITLYESLGRLYAEENNMEESIRFYSEALRFVGEEERLVLADKYTIELGDIFNKHGEFSEECERWRQAAVDRELCPPW